MSYTEVVTYYVRYRESLLKQCYDSERIRLLQKSDYNLTRLVPKPKNIIEYENGPLCVNNLNDLDELTLPRFVQAFRTDAYDGTELLYSHLVNFLVLTKLGIRLNVNLRLYRLISAYFGPFPDEQFKIKIGYTFNLKFKRKKRFFRLQKCKITESRRYLFSLVYRLLDSCLYVKRSVWGINVHLKDLLNVIYYVLHHRNTHSEWEIIEILSSRQNYGFLSLSHFVSNIIFNGNFQPDILVSSASRWKSFHPKYFREVIIMIIFTNALNLNSYAKNVYFEFKRNLNTSLNQNWRQYCSNNLNDLNPCLKYIRLFYVAMNQESPFKRDENVYKYAHPGHFIPKNLVLDDKYNLSFLRYILYVIKLLLREVSSLSVLNIIELVVHYFSYSTLKVGFLKCVTPYKCLNCTATFTEIYCALLDILESLRALNFSFAHLFLVRMLVKNEIERLKTSFFGSYTDDLSKFLSEYKFVQNPTAYLERITNKYHYSPKYSLFLKYRLCSTLLRTCLSRNVSIFIKESSVSSSVKCSWYLKLLFCVDMHVNKVDPSAAINKCLGKNLYLNLEQLNNKPTVCPSYKLSYCGNNVLTDELDILYNLYVSKPSIHQYLPTFTLTDQLNVIQRTQACLVLSKNLTYVEAVLEQLVQCLVIDPGDRIINLLHISLNSERIRSRILYNLSCLIHSNISTATNHKVYAFIKYIFKMLPNDVKSMYTNQILLHGKLLELTMNLADLPLSKRYDELNKNIVEMSKTINEESNLYLYRESDANFMDTQQVDGSETGRLNISRSGNYGPGESHKIVGVDVQSVKILHSATRVPFMLTYRLKSGAERTYIYKMKDDLRQDCLVIQIKNFMLSIFRAHELNVFLQPFLVVPYSSVIGEIFSNGALNEFSPRIHLPRKEFEIGGIVGFIPNTISRHSIGKESCTSIKHYFLKRYGHELAPSYIRAVDNFIASLAGYALLSFLLQVKDRHNGNLLFTTCGHIIHIDFGFILGASPAKDLQFELAPFKFTQEMVEFMGGYNSDNFKRFIGLLINSYLSLRTHSNFLLTLIQLLQYSNIPCFRKSTLIKLRRRLRLNDTPTDAKNYILRKIFYALHSKTTKLYDVVQNYQQGIEH